MNPTPTYEQAMAELDQLLRRLEDGQTTLDESLAHYERGIALLRLCRTKLQSAEQTVLQLQGIDADGKPVLAPFAGGDEK
jgi:exodeoxyribonuclease VII small subunit